MRTVTLKTGGVSRSWTPAFSKNWDDESNLEISTIKIYQYRQRNDGSYFESYPDLVAVVNESEIESLFQEGENDPEMFKVKTKPYLSEDITQELKRTASS